MRIYSGRLPALCAQVGGVSAADLCLRELTSLLFTAAFAVLPHFWSRRQQCVQAGPQRLRSRLVMSVPSLSPLVLFFALSPLASVGATLFVHGKVCQFVAFLSQTYQDCVIERALVGRLLLWGDKIKRNG